MFPEYETSIPSFTGPGQKPILDMHEAAAASSLHLAAPAQQLQTSAMGPTSEFNRTSAEHRNRLDFSIDGQTFLKARLYHTSISSADVTIFFFGDLFFSRRLVNVLPCQEGSQEGLIRHSADQQLSS
jgi:hypothetical protein